MTILPNSNKKKPQQGANSTERELNDPTSTHNHNQGISSHSHQLSNIPNRSSPLQANAENSTHGNHYGSSMGSSTCWSNKGCSAGNRDELCKPHNSHRGSTIGSVRPKSREYRNKGSPPYPSTSGSSTWGHQHEGSTASSCEALQREQQPSKAVPTCPSTDEDHTGYNSGDEHAPFHEWNLTNEQWEEKERWFEKRLKKKNLIIKKMKEDGACLFRAIADQVYGDQDFHAEVRHRCMNYIHRNSDAFQPFVSESFQTYVQRKRQEDCFGNHIEIAAMSEMYNRVIEVYCYSADPINIFQGSLQTDNAPIKLSYHRGTHYNSVVDPFTATVGVGLGLPNLQPGLAEKNLMHDAKQQSETVHLEQTMLEDKIRATDHEATSEAIEEQIVQQSYLDWLATQKAANTSHERYSHEKSSKAGPSLQSTSKSSESQPLHLATNDTGCSAASSSWSQQTELRDMAVAGSSKEVAGSSNANASAKPVPSQFLDLQDCSTEEAKILAQVLALSQQEYLDSLKNCHDSPGGAAERS